MTTISRSRTGAISRVFAFFAAVAMAVGVLCFDMAPAHATGNSNGFVWTETIHSTAFLPTDAVWTGSYYVMISSPDPNVSGSLGSVKRSTDGITWTSPATPPTGRNWMSIAYGNGTLVAVGYSLNPQSYAHVSSNIAYSTDNGNTWTEVDVSSKISYASTVVYGGGKFVVGGAQEKVSYQKGYAIWSSNGSTWNESDAYNLFGWNPGQFPGYSALNYIVYGNGKFIGVSSYDYMIVSTDGATWTPLPLTTARGASVDIISTPSYLSWNGSQFLVQAQWSADVATSPDGVNWTTHTSTGRVGRASWIDGQYYAPDSNYGGIFWFSPDGINWSDYWIDGNTDGDNDLNNPFTYSYPYRFNRFVKGNGNVLALGWGYANGGSTLRSSIPASISPATQTVNGTATIAISPSASLSGSNFTGSVTYAVTSGTLPTGLSLSSSTGVISGTPTAASSATVTITGTGATAGSATTSVTFNILAAPAITPATQTVTSVAGSAITPTTAYTAVRFTGSVTYAVTSGTLPAGLSLSSSTGVISGTPTAASSATVTITGTGATAGSATATVTFAVTAPTTTTTAPAVNTSSFTPATLITESTKSLYEAAPGEATAVVNGVKVPVNVIEVGANATPAEELQVANSIVNKIEALLPAGADSNIAVVKTDTGVELSGLLVNPEDPKEKLSVPVDSVKLLTVGSNSAVLISTLNQTNLPSTTDASGALEVTRNGILAAQAYGFGANESGEIILMSTPILLKTFTVNGSGAYAGQVPLPKGIPYGSHTVVMATRNAKVSLGIKLVRTRLQFRVKRTISTKMFRQRAGVKVKTGGKITITGSGRCRANINTVVMSSKPGNCYVTVRQAAKGSFKAVYYRFTVSVVKKLPKTKK